MSFVTGFIRYLNYSMYFFNKIYCFGAILL